MSFTKEQTDALKAPLDRRHVKSRSQAGRSLSYVEGWHAIAEANRIFGFDAWDRETLELRQLGDAREVDGKWRVAYMARVRIGVGAADECARVVTREGCGYGSGIDRDLGSAHESALKEAETDAMKRALMTFGNPFGLALYDKDQANVADTPREPANEPAQLTMSREHMLHEIGVCGSPQELLDLKKSAAFKRGYAALSQEDQEFVRKACAQLERPAA